MQDDVLKYSQLGKATIYYDQYKPDLLFPIARANNRQSIDVQDSSLSFVGMDIWNGYEFSWLDTQGLPQAKRIQIMVPCNSKFLIESKSFKLYLYSFANSKFKSEDEVVQTISKDLSKAVGNTKVNVQLIDLNKHNLLSPGFKGTCLDILDVKCSEYQVNPEYLKPDSKSEQVVTEILWSNLLKSNCLVTGHPDWGSVCIRYSGQKISHAGLLQYLVSFREHQEFHEHCVERIFTDITQHCKPSQLHVEAKYTRRGGLDINPLRVSSNYQYQDLRLYRQ
jgi:7-cyano-7-deazaguanine reductase